MSRLMKKYNDEVLPALTGEFNLQNKLAAPKVVKIVVNVGIKEGASDKAALDKTTEWMSAICGQRPAKRAAKKSIAEFKIRKGDPIGLSATLRGARMYDFLDKLMNVVLPRVRDFRGVSKSSFDGHGNYSLGLSEQIVFPEVDYAKVDKLRGLEITIVTNADDDKKAYKLLELMGVPFKK